MIDKDSSLSSSPFAACPLTFEPNKPYCLDNQNTEALTDWNRTANNKNVDVFMSQINNTHFIEDCPAWHFKSKRWSAAKFASLRPHFLWKRNKISCRLYRPSSESIINENWWNARIAIGKVYGINKKVRRFFGDWLRLWYGLTVTRSNWWLAVTKNHWNLVIVCNKSLILTELCSWKVCFFTIYWQKLQIHPTETKFLTKITRKQNFRQK